MSEKGKIIIFSAFYCRGRFFMKFCCQWSTKLVLRMTLCALKKNLHQTYCNFCQSGLYILKIFDTILLFPDSSSQHSHVLFLLGKTLILASLLATSHKKTNLFRYFRTATYSLNLLFSHQFIFI